MGKAVKKLSGFGNIHKIDVEQLTISETLEYGENVGIDQSFWEGKGLVDIIEQQAIRFIVADLLKRVITTGKPGTIIIPLTLPGGVVSRYVRFEKLDERFVLAHT